MASFQITIINDAFRSTSEADLHDIAAARAQALKGAMEVGAEQVLAGSPFFGAEVIVADGTVVERFVVSIGVSPLK